MGLRSWHTTALQGLTQVLCEQDASGEVLEPGERACRAHNHSQLAAAASAPKEPRVAAATLLLPTLLSRAEPHLSNAGDDLGRSWQAGGSAAGVS